MRGGNKEGGYGLSAKAVRKHIKVERVRGQRLLFIEASRMLMFLFNLPSVPVLLNFFKYCCAIMNDSHVSKRKATVRNQ